MLKLFAQIFNFSPKKTGLLTFLTLGASFLEGLGISIVVPVIGFMMGKEHSGNFLTDSLKSMTVFLGIEFNMVNILAIMTVIFFIKALIAIWSKYILATVVTEFTYDFQIKTLRSLPQTVYSAFIEKKAGELVSAIVTDPYSASNALNVATSILANIILSIIYVVVLLQISWNLALYSLVVSIVLISPFRFLNQSATRSGNLRVQETDYVTGKVIDFITKIKFFLTSPRLDLHLTKLNRSLLNLKRLNFRNNFLSNLYGVAAQPFSILLISFILVWSQKLSISFDLLVLFIISFLRLPPLVFQAQAMATDLHNLYASFQKMVRLADFFALNRRHDGSEKIQLDGPFTFQAKGLKYSIKGKKIIDIPGLEIKSNGLTFITGESGGGKSTFIELIMGLRPEYEGEFKVGGKEIKQLCNSSWKTQIAYVTQDPVVWHDTFRDNILEYSDLDPARYHDVITEMECSLFMSSFPDNDMTLLTDTAQNLSGGQRQRIALARAFYSKAPIVLLDEVTSALDAKTEGNIIRSIKTLMKREQKTVFFVTHRKSFIEDEDQIIHFHRGNVAFQGRYKDFKDFEHREPS